jgi:hypothetical protein
MCIIDELHNHSGYQIAISTIYMYYYCRYVGFSGCLLIFHTQFTGHSDVTQPDIMFFEK